MFKMGMGSDIEYLKLGLLREIQIFFFLIKQVSISEVYCVLPEKSHLLLSQNPKHNHFFTYRYTVSAQLLAENIC